MFGSGPSGPIGRETELERLRRLVAAHFPVYDTRVGPQSLLLAVHTDRATLEKKFDTLRQELWTLGYVPILRREHGEEFVEVVRRPRVGKTRPWINLGLLVATIGTTTFAGAMIWITYVGRLVLGPSDFLYGFLYFAGPLLAMLGFHEAAHYLVARRRHVDASLPYFIPVPPPVILGTFGAFVSIRQPFPDRKALFDVGVAGPLAGLALALPIAFAGLALSAQGAAPPLTYCGPTLLGQNYGSLLLGPSLLWDALALFFPAGAANVHPLALAGWVGIFITAMNLLPTGTLDGGHVFRALLGDRARYLSYAVALLLFVIGYMFYIGWILIGLLVLFLGLRHPPPLNDLTPLDAKRYLTGAFVAGVLVSGFILVPLAVPPGSVSLTDAHGSAWSNPPPSAAVAANFSFVVHNGDPVPHAFLFAVTLRSVTVTVGSTSFNLSGPSLAAWAANTSWTFLLPGTAAIGPFNGSSAKLPYDGFLALNATSTATIVIVLTNPQSAYGVEIDVVASELCPPPTGGTASVRIPATF